MERIMDTQEARRIVRNVLDQSRGGYTVGDLKHTLVESADGTRFVVIRTGWHQGKNYYGTMQDVELRGGQLFIHLDSLDDELADELMDAGIPASAIVKTYVAPESPAASALQS